MALFCYAVSFALPAYQLQSGEGIRARFDEPSYGYEAFWAPFYFAGLDPSITVCMVLTWCANPAFWLGAGAFVTKRYKGASVLGFIALGLGVIFILYSWFYDGRSPFLVGFFLWLAGSPLLAIAGLVEQCDKRAKFEPRRFA